MKTTVSTKAVPAELPASLVNPAAARPETPEVLRAGNERPEGVTEGNSSCALPPGTAAGAAANAKCFSQTAPYPHTWAAGGDCGYETADFGDDGWITWDCNSATSSGPIALQNQGLVDGDASIATWFTVPNQGGSLEMTVTANVVFQYSYSISDGNEYWGGHSVSADAKFGIVVYDVSESGFPLVTNYSDYLYDTGNIYGPWETASASTPGYGFPFVNPNGNAQPQPGPSWMVLNSGPPRTTFPVQQGHTYEIFLDAELACSDVAGDAGGPLMDSSNSMVAQLNNLSWIVTSQ